MNQAHALHGKQREKALPSEVVLLSHEAGDPTQWHTAGIADLKRALAGQLNVPQPVTSRSRIYLLGEGNASDRTLTECHADGVAAVLADCGLKGAATLSIVADGAGRDPDRDDARQADPGQRSFASSLHRQLLERHGIRTVLQARTGSVLIVSPEEPRPGIASGRKLTSPSPSQPADQHHATQSKLRFSWDGPHQQCEWAY